MRLTEKPEIVTWPETHYLYIEKTGPFQDTAGPAWKTLHQLVPKILERNKITGYMSLYKIAPAMIYRAGVAVSAKPTEIPSVLQYIKFQGGKYSRFVLNGPYSNLPKASRRVMEIVEEKKMKLRDDFYIENYVNDPRTTPEEDLITYIQVPTA